MIMDMVPFLGFGLWTIACIGFGASMMYRKQAHVPPAPMFDPQQVVRYAQDVLHKTEEQANGEELDGTQPMNFKL